MDYDPFRRTRSLVRSRDGAGVAVPLAIATSLLFVAQLVVLGLFLELAIRRDPLRVSAEQVDQARSIAGEPDRLDEGEAVYEQRGLLPLVWRKADSWYGGFLAGCYRRIGAFEHDVSCLVALVMAALVIALARAGLLFVAHRAAATAALGATTSLRRALHRQAFLVGTTNLARPAGQAIDLFVSETQTVRAGLLAWYGPLMREPIKLALLLILALMVHVWLTLAAVLLACLGWYLFTQLEVRWRRAAQAAGEQSSRDLTLLVEGLKQIRLVRSFLMQEGEQQRFERQLAVYRENELGRLRGEHLLGPAVGSFVVAALALVLALIGLVALQGSGPGLPAMIVLFAALLSAYWPVVELSRAYPHVAEARRAAAKIFVYLHRSLQVPQVAGARFLDPLARQLEFDGVSLGGTSRLHLLDGVSFQIEAGTKLAVLSLLPDEPRAIAYLVARLVDPHEGAIRIDGRDIAEVTLESLREQVGLVMQDELLFTGTVAENIGCGDPGYSLSQVSDAAKLAHAHQFIQGLPQGYETVVGDHGLSLTLSQKFRIGLARAALRDPALLVIEEPDEPLDADTKALVDDTLDRLCPGRTVLFLPGRNSTLRRADSVLVLHEGKVAAFGEHRELVQTSDLYRHVQYERFNEFRRTSSVAS